MTIASIAAPPVNRRRLMVGVADQAFWSGAFFLFTANLGLGASTLFAQVAVATGFGLIVLAVTRTWTIDSALLFVPGHARSARRTGSVFLVSGGGAALAYLAWTTLILHQPVSWPAAFLAFGLVFGDSARYTWTTSGRSDRSLPLSVGYFVGAGAALVATWQGMPGTWATCSWALLLCVLGSVGFVDGPEDSALVAELGAVRRRRGGLTLEALYFMTASQAAVLMLSVVGDVDDVAGMRLAYAVALAPAALLIQGAGTQVLRLQGTAQGTARGISLGQLWGWSCVVVYALNTMCVLVLIDALNGTSLELAKPFMLPLCALLAAQAVSNAMHTVMRYHVTVSMSLGLRVVTLTIDVALQLGGLVVAGTDGLIAGLYVAAGIRLLLWLWMSAWTRGRSG